jgi:hypothetical protein
MYMLQIPKYEMCALHFAPSQYSNVKEYGLFLPQPHASDLNQSCLLV